MKKWYKSKVIWFNIIGIVVAAAQELLTVFQDATLSKIAVFVIAIGNIWLRILTTQGIENSGNINRS